MNYCSRVYHFIATRFPRKPVVYLSIFGIWGLTLWFLSAGNPAPKNGPEIPHLDKLAHFLYFSAGGASLATFGLVFRPDMKNRRWLLFVLVALICSVIGRLDEYHQTFTPGRSGNDTGDWIADSLGGAAGVIFVIYLILPGIRQVGRMRNKSMNK